MIFKPHEYQKRVIDRLTNGESLALFLDMGLGKTVITGSALAALPPESLPALVVAPKVVAQMTWDVELAKWDHTKHLRVSKVLGPEGRRIDALLTPADVYVTNRENVQWLVEYYGAAWPFKTLILDELSSFKNPSSKRFRALRKVRKHIKQVIGLTGTPASNGLLDLWAQMYLVDGGESLGPRFTGYREFYFMPDKRGPNVIYSWKPRPGASKQIAALIAPRAVSMSAADYLDLPELMIDDVPVYMPHAVQKRYQQMEREAVLELDPEVIDAPTAAVVTSKLLQLAGGALYDENGEAVTISSHKIEAFVEALEALNGHAVLLFYNFTHERDRIEEALRSEGVTHARLDEDGIAKWRTGDVRVLIAHPASAAYGLNLQDAAHHVIWYGLPWSLELYAQANARLHRQGQREPVIVHRLICADTVDQDVADALASKHITQAAILEAVKMRHEERERHGERN